MVSGGIQPRLLPHPGDLVITPLTVPYEVRTEQTSPRVLAAVRATTTPQRLSAEIIGLLDDDKRNDAGAEPVEQPDPVAAGIRGEEAPREAPRDLAGVAARICGACVNTDRATSTP